MHTTTWRTVGLVGAVVFGLSGLVSAGERRIPLREHLDKTWPNELVTFPFTAGKGECHPASVTLTGPKGPMPVQLSHVKCWPGTKWVRTAKLSFITDLAPLARDTYVVRYGTQPTKASPPTTDLKITPAEGQVTVETRRCGIRLPVGSKAYTTPVAASEVPGPVLAMRLADGTWFGGSRLFGKTKVKSWSAKLTAAGPVFAEAEFRYTYAHGNRARYVAQLAAGDNGVLWDAEVKEHRPGDGWDLVLSRGLPPLVFRVHMEWGNPRKVFQKRWEQVKQGKAVPAGTADLRLDQRGPGDITYLIPWPDWFSDLTQTIIPLTVSGRDVDLQIASRDAGAWVEPLDLIACIPGKPGSGKRPPASSLGAKQMPLTKGANGKVSLRVNAAVGRRKWTVSEYGPKTARLATRGSLVSPLDGTQRDLHTRLTEVGRRLNTVKDYVLDWPTDPKNRHPRIYLTRDQLARVWKRQSKEDVDKAVARVRGAAMEPQPWGCVDAMVLGQWLRTGSDRVGKAGRLAARLRRHLGKLGAFDKMRYTCNMVSMYDALIDSDLVSAEERRVFRAQMAYLAYVVTDPLVWSVERGYCSGNRDMSVFFLVARGMMACVLPDHPMAPTWAKGATRFLDECLADIEPGGEWPESASGYAFVSANALMPYAVAATNSGLRDFVGDPRMKRFMLLLAKLFSPPDPRYPNGGPFFPWNSAAAPTPPRPKGCSFVPGLGDCINRYGVPGMMARATTETDPSYSAALQWVWLRAGCPRLPYALAGWEYVYMDEALPSKRPDWTMDVFPRLGVFMRAALDSGKEEFLALVTNDWLNVFPSETGNIPVWFSKGVPLVSSFCSRYPYRQELLMNRVVLARAHPSSKEGQKVFAYRGSLANNWLPDNAKAVFGKCAGESTIHAASHLPRQYYAAVDVAMRHPMKNSYGVIEDLPEWPAVPGAGKPPLDWRRQVLFLKDDAPGGAHYLLVRDTVQGNQPTRWQLWTVSEKIGTPSQVRDLKGFLADKPGHKIMPARELPPGDRYTAIGRFGVDLEFYIAQPARTPRHTLRWGRSHDYQLGPLKPPEYHDLLHLQMPGDGAYFVALFARNRNEPPPQFDSLGEGRIIRVRGSFGTDYAFLSATDARSEGKGVLFHGTAGSVQDRRQGGLVLSLGAAGEVRYREYGLSSKSPAAVRIQKEALTVSVPTGHAGTTVTLSAPGQWTLKHPPAGATVSRKGASRHVLALPVGTVSVKLTKRRETAFEATQRENTRCDDACGRCWLDCARGQRGGRVR